MNYIIDLKDVSKSFARDGNKTAYSSIKSLFLGRSHNQIAAPRNVAINDITLRILPGLSVGIIGRNGSGKSTLLKIITGIYKPEVGSVAVNGRIASLIELGAGFHPDFTGRENLMLGGTIFGMTRKEIQTKFNDIVNFAELEDFIDQPVRTYSSGMFMRLGFSLAVHTEPDLLLIDEVLAVGDAAFTHKCQAKVAELRKSKRTLLVVSHDLAAVAELCDEVIWLEKGGIKDRGEPRRVIDHYIQFIESGEEAELQRLNATTSTVATTSSQNVENRWGSREVEIVSVGLADASGIERALFHTNDSAIIEIDLRFREQISDCAFGIGIHRTDGVHIFGSNTHIEAIEYKVEGLKKIKIKIPRLGLLSGEYTLDIAAHRKKDGYPYDYRRGVVKFAVRSPHPQVGVYAPELSWDFGY